VERLGKLSTITELFPLGYCRNLFGNNSLPGQQVMRRNYGRLDDGAEFLLQSQRNVEYNLQTGDKVTAKFFPVWFLWPGVFCL